MKATNNYQVCLVLYFQEFRLSAWEMAFYDFTIDLARTLNFGINYFGIEHRCEKGVLKSGKIYRYIERNLGKLRDMLGEDEVWGLSFNYSPDPDINRNSVFISAINADLEYKPYRLIYIEMPYTGAFPFEVLSKILDRVEQLAQIQYGLCTVMAIEKLPAYYFLDLGVNTLDDEEVFNLNAWDRHKEQYFQMLRGLYEGNILGKGHLERLGGIQRVLDALTQMGVSYKELSFDTLFIPLPVDHLSREKVGAFFRSILMPIEDEDRVRDF